MTDNYLKELQFQLAHSGKLKTSYSFIYGAYKRSFFDKWVKGITMVIFEAVFYFMFIACLTVTVMFLFYNPIALKFIMSEVSGKVVVTEVTEGMVMILKILAVLFSVSLLFPGLLLRAIRKKNGLIDDFVSVIEENVNIETEREERIRNVLRE